MKLIVSTFLVYKVKKCLLKSGKVKVAFFCLLPGYGKILPSTRAILCHFQAQNNTSGGKFGQDYHLDLGYGCSQSRFARKNPTLDFTLHSSPNRLKPR